MEVKPVVNNIYVYIFVCKDPLSCRSLLHVTTWSLDKTFRKIPRKNKRQDTKSFSRTAVLNIRQYYATKCAMHATGSFNMHSALTPFSSYPRPSSPKCLSMVSQASRRLLDLDNSRHVREWSFVTNIFYRGSSINCLLMEMFPPGWLIFGMWLNSGSITNAG